VSAAADLISNGVFKIPELPLPLELALTDHSVIEEWYIAHSNGVESFELFFRHTRGL